MITSARAHDFASFRARARVLVSAHVAPRSVHWQDELFAQASLFAEVPEATESAAPLATLRVPRRFVELGELAALYRSPDRFELLYRILFRLTHERADLLDDELDRDVRELGLRVQAVRRDEHRMHAFVRFRRTELEGAERYVAWYRPEHLVLRLCAPFFARRFAAMRWAILTPDESASWEGQTLHFGPGAPCSEAPADDELEALFRTYYASTYNPARNNPRLFQKHVPEAFRAHMPELVQGSLEAAHASRVTPEVAAAAAPLVPAARELPTLAAAARHCAACPLAGPATQTVFGEGPSAAALMLVGEQPGDQEDLSGRPFVGPAGQLLDRALADAGLARGELYVTNAVKHFGYRPMGNKRRLHVRPEWRHIEACRPWLSAELETVRPRVIVCLGATAAQSFFGRRFALLKNRGRTFQGPWAEAIVVTHHPSALLRMEGDARERAYAELLADLRVAGAHVQRSVES